MTRISDVAEIKRVIDQGHTFSIIVHKGPDGDAMGSSLGWARILSGVGKQVQVITPDAFPHFLNWLPGCENVQVYDRDTREAEKSFADSDGVFCLDFNAPGRMGDAWEFLKGAGKPLIVVDHHQAPDSFANHYYTDDTASSTAEMIFRLASELGFENLVDQDVAYCLYTGLVTDTGSFRFDSVSPDVLRIAASLIETGMDHTRVYAEVYDSNTLSRLRLQGFALSEKLQVIEDGRVAYITLSADELAQFSFQKGDTEGLVNYGLSISGVRLAAFFSEKDGVIKISFRSKGQVNVNELARAHFNGGGHVNAAGGRGDGAMEETIEKFKSVVSNWI